MILWRKKQDANEDKCKSMMHAGYTEELCDVDIDDCDPNLCQNGGNCIDGIKYSKESKGVGMARDII